MKKWLWSIITSKLPKSLNIKKFQKHHELKLVEAKKNVEMAIIFIFIYIMKKINTDLH